MKTKEKTKTQKKAIVATISEGEKLDIMRCIRDILSKPSIIDSRSPDEFKYLMSTVHRGVSLEQVRVEERSVLIFNNIMAILDSYGIVGDDFFDDFNFDDNFSEKTTS